MGKAEPLATGAGFGLGSGSIVTGGIGVVLRASPAEAGAVLVADPFPEETDGKPGLLPVGPT